MLSEVEIVNKVKVRIMGREYTLGTENSPEYTMELAEKLNASLNEMLSDTHGLSGLDVALLAALDAMDEARKAKENADNIRLQLGEYMTSADKARTGYDNAKKEIAVLKRRIEELEDKLGGNIF